MVIFLLRLYLSHRTAGKDTLDLTGSKDTMDTMGQLSRNRNSMVYSSIILDMLYTLSPQHHKIHNRPHSPQTLNKKRLASSFL